MDKQLIEKVALEEWAGPDNTRPIMGKNKILDFSTRFLTRIDAERGKKAVAQESKLLLNGKTLSAFGLEHLYDFQEATGCDTAEQYLANKKEAQEPIGTLRNSSLGGLSIEIHAPDIAEAGMRLYAVPQPPAKQEAQPVAEIEHEEPDAPFAWKRAKLNNAGLKLPHGTKLYATQQPPAPCPDCEARANGDTVLVLSSELKKLQAKVAEQSTEIERLKAYIEGWRFSTVKQQSDTIAQQAERIAELEQQCSDLEGERDDAENQPWPEWSESILKIIRKRSGYDGFDDADGIDLPEELRELLAGNEAEFDRQRAKLVTATERIAELEAMKCTSPREDSQPCRGIQKQLDRVKEQAALIAQCGTVLSAISNGCMAEETSQYHAEEALAAIAAHKKVGE